jgi:hypothetical protein
VRSWDRVLGLALGMTAIAAVVVVVLGDKPRPPRTTGLRNQAGGFKVSSQTGREESTARGTTARTGPA